MTMTMTQAEPDTPVGSTKIAAALDVPRSLLCVYLDRWRHPFLGAPAQEARGSGTRRLWSPRDVVVMAMLVDTMGKQGEAVCNRRLRRMLADEIYATEWGSPIVTAATGALSVAYSPRWDTAHAAVAA